VYEGDQEKVERLIKVMVCYFNAPHLEQLTGKSGFQFGMLFKAQLKNELAV
jgi:hypothetical protein